MVRRTFATWLGIAVALAATGGLRAQSPTPVQGLPIPARPAAGNPLATDGLMAPPPSVPPRTAYQLPPTAPAQPGAGPLNLTLPEGAQIPIPSSQVQNFRFSSRYGKPFNFSSEMLPDKVTRRWIFVGGLIVNVGYGRGGEEIEFATDEAVIWEVNADSGNLLNGIQSTPENKKRIELYLTGNVVIRSQNIDPKLGPVTQTLRAEQIYYDVSRNRAVALKADLEFGSTRVPDGVHLQGAEIDRLGLSDWEVLGGSAFSSKMPSDPGLRIDADRVSLSERRAIRKNVFGIPYRDLRTGEYVEGSERTITARNSVTRLGGVPVFYLPYLRTDANDPLGPFVGLSFGQSRMFGTQVYTTWDMYKLLALRPPEGHTWRLNLDYMSARGPAAGSDYSYNLPARDSTGLSPGGGEIVLYGINDKATEDILGGNRGQVQDTYPPGFRGRAQWRHVQDLNALVDGLYFQGQAAFVSDQNFLEQFYKTEWDLGPNQETFGYLTWNRRNFEATALAMPRLARPWIAQTEWFPRLDGYLVGQSLFDLFNYSASANAAYAQARPSQLNPGPVLATDQRIDTARLDLNQELSLPFDLGPLKVAPYGTLDLSYYSNDLTGDQRGRVIGGGGLRSSVPFSRLYEGAASELFNVRGLYHKVMLGSNYYYAQSDTPYWQLPLLDRLNDDAVDQGYRNIKPFEPMYLPGANGTLLASSPLYDPQLYMIRRLADNRIDTRDSVNVMQMDLRQRFQTKRGYPGLEHTVDFFTLDLSASYFPQMYRDNFGKPFAFLEYNALWNAGDRTAVQSSGWFDPYNNGTRYWTAGVFLDRPDRTNLYFGYRQTDPLNSKAVTGTVGYQMSRRYFVNAGVSYDFGIQQALTNSFTLTRTGSDMTLTVGVTYNALVNNFGVQFMIVPNIVAFTSAGRFGGTPLTGR